MSLMDGLPRTADYSQAARPRKGYTWTYGCPGEPVSRNIPVSDGLAIKREEGGS
jgi:hypothetical protein